MSRVACITGLSTYNVKVRLKCVCSVCISVGVMQNVNKSMAPGKENRWLTKINRLIRVVEPAAFCVFLNQSFRCKITFIINYYLYFCTFNFIV